LINEISEEYVKQHKRKVYLANEYPHLKIDEIELLNEIISDEEIDNRERDKGNI